jgi:hypothetical protein
MTRVCNPETQAQIALMRKWDITSEQRAPEADAMCAYDDIHRSALGLSHPRAIRALFMA